MTVKTNYPQDDARTMYLENDLAFSEIVRKIKEKWGEVDLSKITIAAEWRHVDHLTYEPPHRKEATTFAILRTTNTML